MLSFIRKFASRSSKPATNRRPKNNRVTLTMDNLEARDVMSVTPIGVGQIPQLDAIQFKYLSLGGTNGYLGTAVTGEMATPVGGGLYQLYAGGAIFYSSSTGAHVVSPQTEAEWERDANLFDGAGHNVQAIIGLPTTDEVASTTITNVFSTTFQGGHITHSTQVNDNAIHTFTTYGAIDAEYQATATRKDGFGVNVQKILGAPIGEEQDVPGVPGARMSVFQGGAIYWSSATGAHAVYGDIYAKYQSVGPVAYGLPITSETDLPYVAGARQVMFQTGNIVWSQSTGAHLIYGAILSEYNALAGVKAADGSYIQTTLGAPTTDEMDVAVIGVSGARENTFQGGAIYWSSATGAHVVFGEYYRRYLLGGPWRLGLPISDEVPWGTSHHAILFQHDVIFI
jgi:uncharacterized protein with LGFP repeats